MELFNLRFRSDTRTISKQKLILAFFVFIRNNKDKKEGDFMNIEVNFVAVILAAIVNMVLGFLWYSPMVLGKQWMSEKHLSAESLKKAQSEMGKLYGLSFVAAIITAYVLTHVMTLSENYFHYSMLSTGLNTAFWLWLGFVLPVQLTDSIFGDKNWKLLAINTGYQLVGLLLMAVVISWLA